jgi:hypothetical protein
MKRIIMFLLLLGTVAAARSEDATATALPQLGGGRSAFGEIKYRALETQAQLERVLYPAGDVAGAGSRVYFGDAAGGFLLQRLSLSVDGGTPAVMPLADEDVRALAGTADLLWLKDLSLARGEHTLQVEMQAGDLSKPDHPTQTFSLDAQVEIGNGESSIELKLVPGDVLSSAHIDLVQHESDGGRHGWLSDAVTSIGGLVGTDAGYSPGRPADPAMRYIKHLMHMTQGDAAVVQLLRIAQSTADLNTLPPQFWLQLSSALRLANLPDQAQAICDRLDIRQEERESVAVEHLRLGIQQYGLGDTAKAEAQLLSAQGRLPPYRVQDWQVAYAEILFSRNQYAEARRVLQSGNVDSDDAYRFMQDSVEAVRTSAYRRFNLAVAMVQSGDAVKGLSLLDLVGRLRSSDGDLLTLRDKANLMLGWHFLRNKQGGTAIGILGRVRSDGQYSSTALLGMGWAQLQPAGKKLARVRLGEDSDDATNPLAIPASIKNSLSQLGVLEPEMRGEVGPHSFSQDKPPANREDGLRRALQFWQRLTQRDANEPAVQEGLLAVAYALYNLYETPAAREAYTHAIGALEAQKRDIAAHTDFIRNGGLASAIAAARSDADLALVMGPLNLTPSDSARPLYASIDRYRSLTRLQQDLTDEQTLISRAAGGGTSTGRAIPDTTALLAALAAALRSEADRLQSLAQTELDHQRQGIDEYLKIAYFAAARATDDTLISEPHK